MSESSPLQPGHKVAAGRFTLVQALGRGGMAEVWLAQDERLGEPVALKFLPVEVRADPVALDDLRRETARSHRLTHPNIVRIHDLHEEPGEMAFIVMEYVDGPTLAGLRLEQPERVLSWEFLRPLVQQLCAALDYAHGEKVIHRDLKPANVMVDGKGRLKLADFGIAATVSDSVSRVSGRHPTSGTLPYMSPQQLAGKHPQVADDIYALGATLYELLTSKPPFYTGDITHQVLHEAPEPPDDRLAALGLANAVPPDVAAMIMACLAKEPGQRPQSARAVAEWIGLALVAAPGIKHLLQAVGLTATECGPESTPSVRPADAGKKRLWLPLGITTLVLCGFAAWHYGHRRPGEEASSIPSPQRGTSTAPDSPSHSSRQPVELPGELASQFVWIPPGTFTMGSPASEQDGNPNEGPQTSVTLSQGFWMGKYLVTQEDYEALLGNNPSFFKGVPNRPVENVNWFEATNYCNRLTRREREAGRIPAGFEFRLPTEAEWEYACRAGTTTRFSYGDDSAYGEFKNFGWCSANSGLHSHPVGQKSPNAWGLYDMHGNVFQWCQSWYGAYPGGSVTDPQGPSTGSSRVYRGGSCGIPASNARSAMRGNMYSPDAKFNTLGFRIVLAESSAGKESEAKGGPDSATTPSSTSASSTPAASEEGFISLFNGRDLSGWSGDPQFWSVKDGCITAQTSPGNSLKKSTFLIWKGGAVGDFELRLSCKRVTGKAGVQYRSKVLDPVKWVVGGYQIDTDIPFGSRLNGALYEPNGRGVLANCGERVVRAGNGQKQVIGSTALSQDALQAATKQGDWNEYVVIARSNHLIHQINGNVTMELTDNELGKRALSGVLALEFWRPGQAMLVQFKDIRLKRLKD